MPLVELESIVGNGGRKGSGRVSVQSVAIGQLRFVVLTVGGGERLDVSKRAVEFFLNAIDEGEVAALSRRQPGEALSGGTDSLKIS